MQTSSTAQPPPAARPTADRPSVVHVVLALDTGGLERVVLNLVRHGPALGQRVSVLCVERPGGLADDVRAVGADVRCLDKPPGLRPSAIGRAGVALRELAADVVHTHQIGALFYAGPAARRAGVGAVVHTEHGRHYDAARLRTRLLARFAAGYAQRFFCVSQDIADAAVARGVAPPGKVGVVANGIETARFAGPGDRDRVRQSLDIPAGAAVVGTVGNLREVKRQDVLIRGFARLPADLPAGPPHLLLVGDGPLRADLEQLAVDLGVAGRVHFAGRQPDPERFLHAMDVFALTSRSEGMPLAVLEAWAAGLPVVASNVGGLPALVSDGQTGLLFESGDDAMLAERLGRLLSDRAATDRIGEAGRQQAVARYDVAAMAGTYDQHYRALLATTGSGNGRRGGAAVPPERTGG